MHKGSILKQMRESKGVALQVVHETTKIPMDALRAIEEGYTVRTLTPFYYRGFIKMYAKYLGVDAHEVLDEVREEVKEEPKEEKVEQPPKKSYHVKTDSQELDFNVQEALSKIFNRQRKEQTIALIAILAALFVIIKIVGFIGGLVTTKPNTKVEQVKGAPTEGRVSEKKTDSKTVVKTVASNPAKPRKRSTPPVAAKGVSLTVRAKKSSWLQVKTDGNVVFQSTLKKGAVENWTADESIELSGKNINELEFELNGKLIGSLGRADRRARKLFVTKDGLTVKK